MRFEIGNPKLGPSVVHMSRPVGPTCPTSCRFFPRTGTPKAMDAAPDELRNKCYMVRFSRMVQGHSGQIIGEDNLTANLDDIRAWLRAARQRGALVRLHVGGDWETESGGLDWPYISTWAAALRLERENLPRILCFTHCLVPELPWVFNEFAPAFQLIASVHTVTELAQAERARFTRFALAMAETYYQWDEGQAWLDRLDARWLVCPEQRGKLPNCESCGYCWRPDRGNVAFLEHSNQNAPKAWRERQREARP